MKHMIISLMVLAAVSVQAALISDDFNRADAHASGAATLTTIGNDWTGEGSRRWDIAGSNLVSNTGTGSYIYNAGLETLNSAMGTSFTQVGYIILNKTAASAYGGMVVNFDTNTDTGITFRFNGIGAVQFQRPNGTGITSGTFSETYVSDREYRMTISSSVANTYDLEIFDTVLDTVVFGAHDVVNGGASASSDGYGGFYANTAGITYDDFSLNTVPEPATLGLLMGSSLAIIGLRRLVL
jgi:hypothetical protein